MIFDGALSARIYDGDGIAEFWHRRLSICVRMVLFMLRAAMFRRAITSQNIAEFSTTTEPQRRPLKRAELRSGGSTVFPLA